MAFLDFFRRKAQSSLKQIPIVSDLAAEIFNRLLPDHSNDELYTGWVFACVQAIAEQYAIINLKLFRKNSNGDKEQIFDHPALTLLNYVNEGSTKYDLFFATGAHLELNGAYYWIVLPNNLGVPSEIMMPDPTRMKPIIDTSGVVTEYRYYQESGSKYASIDPALVVPFRNFNPKNNVEGKSTLSAARPAIETDEYAKVYNRNWFKNSARPDIVLKFDTDLNKDQREKLKEDWKQRYAGVQNTGKMLIAPKGMSVETISANHADMEYIEGRKYSREEILGIFRVPKPILGLTEEVQRSNMEAAMYAFVSFTMMPKYRKGTHTLNEFFLSMFKDFQNLEFEFTNVPPEDPQALVTELVQGIAGGLYTINDARRKLGLPEIENGDVIFVPPSFVAYGGVAKTPSKHIEAPIKKSIDGFTSKIAEEITKSFKEQIINPTENPIPEMQVENSKASLDEAFEEKGVNRGKATDELLKPFEKQFKEVSQKLFDEQKIRAIEKVKKMQKNFSIKAAQDILDQNKEVKFTIDAFTPLFEDLIATAGTEALKYIGSKEDFNMAKASDFIKNNTTRFAKDVTAKTAQDLRVLIATGVDQGESIYELTNRIENYVGFSEARSETIARTETIRGGAAADIEAWSQSGVVSKAIWYTALDERVDDFCSYLHGTEVDLGDDFMSENDLIDHGIQPYDGGLNMPPAHPNCRCLLIPVIN